MEVFLRSHFYFKYKIVLTINSRVFRITELYVHWECLHLWCWRFTQKYCVWIKWYFKPSTSRTVLTLLCTKSEVSETDHVENKHHLCSLRAHISVLSSSAMRMLLETVTFASIVTVRIPAHFYLQDQAAGYHVHWYSICPLSLATGIWPSTLQRKNWHQYNSVCKI